jgi:hypothetical protein
VILFLGSVRVLSLVEGRVVEVMLGERMPRRPLYSARDKPWLQRISAMFTDPRTWGTLLYMLAMLPLGIVYFTVAVALLAVSLSFMAAPLLVWFGEIDTGIGVGGWQFLYVDNDYISTSLEPWALPLLFVAGALLLFVTLHLARGLGVLHGQLAKHLLVNPSQSA